jgi:hypothetical protein
VSQVCDDHLLGGNRVGFRDDPRPETDPAPICDLLRRTDVRYGAHVHLHEVESLRRSFAIGGTLTPDDTERLLDTCATLLAERVRIERILRELGPAWGGARKALNELSKVLKHRER